MIDQERPARERALSSEPVENTTPAQRPDRGMKLSGRFVRVEPLSVAAHGDDLFPLASDPAVDASWEYLAYGPWRSETQYLSWLAEQSRSTDPFFYAFRDPATDRAIGIGSYLRIEPNAQTTEIGHLWFSPLLQRTPAATEAIYLLLRHAFGELGNRRVEWKCNALNAASRRAAVRFGFTFEGLFYRHYIVKGKNRDTAWYSMLKEEWPAIRAAYETWLAPENFDARGQELRSLGELTSAS